MGRYLCNAPGVGSYVEGYGIIPDKAEFEMPDGVEPHTMWLPLDKAAVANFKRHSDKFIAKAKADAEALGEPLTEADVKKLAKQLEPLPDLTPQSTDAEERKVLIPVFKSRKQSRPSRDELAGMRASDSE